MQIGILNGPNLNLLGRRNTDIYGKVSFEAFLPVLRKKFPQADLIYHQSNSEGQLIDILHEWGFKLDGIVFNPAAYTHTSIALADAVEAIESPVVEVHISKIEEREDFRQVSYLRKYCLHHITGKGLDGYAEAVDFLIKNLG